MSIRSVPPVNGLSGLEGTSSGFLDVSLGPPPPIKRPPPPHFIETEDYTIWFLDPETSLTEFVKEDYDAAQQRTTAGMDERRWQQFLRGIKTLEEEEDVAIPSLWEDLLPESFFHVAQTVSSASHSALALIGSAQRSVGKIRGIAENIEEHTHIGERTGILVSSMLARSIDLGKKGLEAAKNYANPPDS